MQARSSLLFQGVHCQRNVRNTDAVDDTTDRDISQALLEGNQSTINVHPYGCRSLASVHRQGDW